MQRAHSVDQWCERIAEVVFQGTRRLDIDHHKVPPGFSDSWTRASTPAGSTWSCTSVEGEDDVERRVDVKLRHVNSLEGRIRQPILTGLVAAAFDGVLGNVVSDERRGWELTRQNIDGVPAAAAHICNADASPKFSVSPLARAAATRRPVRRRKPGDLAWSMTSANSGKPSTGHRHPRERLGRHHQCLGKQRAHDAMGARLFSDSPVKLAACSAGSVYVLVAGSYSRYLAGDECAEPFAYVTLSKPCSRCEFFAGGRASGGGLEKSRSVSDVNHESQRGPRRTRRRVR